MDRHSNIELLRIISMLLIIMFHYSIYGGFTFDTSHLSLNKIIIQFLSAGGQVGVNCFVLITGFFLIKSNFTFEKLFKLSISVATYSVSIYIVFLACGLTDFNIRNTVKYFFPIIFYQYWFVTNYVLIYIFSPFINEYIKSINRQKHLNIILLLTIIWSLIPTVTSANFHFSPLIWFFILYLISAYIRIYPDNFLEKLSLSSFIYIFLLILFSILFLDIAGTKINILGRNACYFIKINSLPLLACSLSLFIGLKNHKINSYKILNTISSSTLGVYLIHDNNLVRNILWTEIFKNNQYLQSNYLFLHAVLTTIIIFIICIIIDKIKKIFIDAYFFRLYTVILKSKIINILSKYFTAHHRTQQ